MTQRGFVMPTSVCTVRKPRYSCLLLWNARVVVKFWLWWSHCFVHQLTELFANVPTYQEKYKKKEGMKITVNIFILYRFKMAPEYVDLLTEKRIDVQSYTSNKLIEWDTVSHFEHELFTEQHKQVRSGLKFTKCNRSAPVRSPMLVFFLFFSEEKSLLWWRPRLHDVSSENVRLSLRFGHPFTRQRSSEPLERQLSENGGTYRKRFI